MILQHEKPDDFVCATGISHSVGELVDYVFNELDLEKERYVGIDKRFYRPDELVNLKGDATKSKEVLGLELEYTFETMLDEMILYWLDYYKERK